MGTNLDQPVAKQEDVKVHAIFHEVSFDNCYTIFYASFVATTT